MPAFISVISTFLPFTLMTEIIYSYLFCVNIMLILKYIEHTFLPFQQNRNVLRTDKAKLKFGYIKQKWLRPSSQDSSSLVV